MIVYVDPKTIGKNNLNALVQRYPSVEFVTDLSRSTEIEVLFAWAPKVVKEMRLEDYPKLKWIQYAAAGYDGVDLSKIKQHNIIFSNAQNVFSKAIAEDVFAKIMYFNRHIRKYVNAMEEMKWEPQQEFELTNSTALILGVGSIGKELSKRMKGFEMNIIGYRKNKTDEPNFDKIITLESELTDALTIADYVILALPLNEDTIHMFDLEKFRLMKKSALFINVARGKIVNQEDLYFALSNHLIRGAGLDVVDPEPLPVNHPLWSLDNVYITPHNASSSPYLKDRLYQMFTMNLDLYLAGEPIKYRLI